MKHLQKFENFHLEDPMGSEVDTDEQSYLDYRRKMRSIERESEFPEEEEEGDWDWEEEIPVRKTFGDEVEESKKSVSYKKSGLKNPEKADLNKTRKLKVGRKQEGRQ
jgi:hypothetical protein